MAQLPTTDAIGDDIQDVTAVVYDLLDPVRTSGALREGVVPERVRQSDKRLVKAADRVRRGLEERFASDGLATSTPRDSAPISRCAEASTEAASAIDAVEALGSLVPRAVHDFIAKASGCTGAPLDLLTDEVRPFLDEHGLVSRYRIWQGRR